MSLWTDSCRVSSEKASRVLSPSQLSGEEWPALDRLRGQVLPLEGLDREEEVGVLPEREAARVVVGGRQVARAADDLPPEELAGRAELDVPVLAVLGGEGRGEGEEEGRGRGSQAAQPACRHRRTASWSGLAAKPSTKAGPAWRAPPDGA
jgi:hypothetical protein